VLIGCSPAGDALKPQPVRGANPGPHAPRPVVSPHGHKGRLLRLSCPMGKFCWTWCHCQIVCFP